MNTWLTHFYFYFKPYPCGQDYVQTKLISKIDPSDFKRAKDLVLPEYILDLLYLKSIQIKPLQMQESYHHHLTCYSYRWN